jgi:hypothetical protein
MILGRKAGSFEFDLMICGLGHVWRERELSVFGAEDVEGVDREIWG